MLSSLIRNSARKVFPNIITQSNIIRSEVDIVKVFPEIGLENCKESIDIKFDFDNVPLDKVIYLAVRKFLDEWRDNHAIGGLKGLEQVKMSKTIHVLQELSRRFSKREGIECRGSRVILTTSIPSYDGKPLVKSGADVFKLAKTLFTYGKKYVRTELVSPEDMKEQCKNLQIVFSADGIDGAWDIATMSMRGIKSCMRWEATQAVALNGSITDPCCGIIYITNGSKTAYGSKMLFRAVVRLALHKTTLKPCLFVDRIYSTFYKTKPGEIGQFDEKIKSIFIEFLKKKVPNCTVADAQASDNNWLNSNYMLPNYTGSNFMSNNEYSYRDTPIQYSSSYTYAGMLPDIKKSLSLPIKKKLEKKSKTTKKLQSTY